MIDPPAPEAARAQALSHVRRVTTPGLVVAAPGEAPVQLLLVTEWADSMSFHLSWPWLTMDVRCNLRQAYHLSDAAGASCQVIDSRVLPLAGRMNEVTFFDTRAVDGSQTLALRLRSQLAVPVAIPFEG
jgi:hypothetical protein